MTFIKEIFQKLFGGSNNHHDQGFHDQHKFGEQFKNPIWRNDDDDDDDYPDEYRRFGNGNPEFHFEIFTNPLEITRYFESQMESMLKDFFHFPFNDQSVESFSNPQLPQLLPPPESGHKSLRDEVLKPGYEVPPPNYGISVPKVDENLDGKVTADDLSRVWANPGIPDRQNQLAESFTPGFRSFGRSIVSQTIRRPDGTTEERRTVTDSHGNSETTIKRQIGDKIHTIITKRDKNGVEMKTENFENNEKSLKSLDLSPIEPKFESGLLTRFPWHKFFEPKL